MVVRHLAAQRKLLAEGALTALAMFALAGDATAAVVRSVRATASDAATRIVVDVDGEFRYRTHPAPDGGTVFVDIEDVTLAPGAARILPVSDNRVDGVIVLDDAGARIVRVSVDIAGRVAPRLDAVVDGSHLVLTFVDASNAPPAAVTNNAPSSVGTNRAPSAAVTSSAPSAAVTKGAPSAAVMMSAPPPAVATSTGTQPSRRRGSVDPGRREAAASAKEPATAAIGSSSAPRRSVLERPLVVLDPGHGGKDPGASAWTGEFEKNIVLDLAERVARRLRKGGEVEVVMTRSGDEYVTLADRRDTSRRWGADVFVSIHANASGSAAARGIETYYYSRSRDDSGGLAADREVRRLARLENGGKAMRDRSIARRGVSRTSLDAGSTPLLDRHAESVRLARLVQTELVRQLGMRYEAVRDLGAKEGPFFVIGDNAAPSVLVEAAFLTHREEGLRMRSEVYREQIADGVSRGILAFLEEQRAHGAL